jgi:hypothetical protein
MFAVPKVIPAVISVFAGTVYAIPCDIPFL